MECIVKDDLVEWTDKAKKTRGDVVAAIELRLGASPPYRVQRAYNIVETQDGQSCPRASWIEVGTMDDGTRIVVSSRYFKKIV